LPLRQSLSESRNLPELPPLILPDRAHIALCELARCDHLNDARLFVGAFGRAAAVQVEHRLAKVDRRAQRFNPAFARADLRSTK
jgi:hypothetical protein